MKITKRQLRRIIKEERSRLVRETRDQADQNLKAYQDGYHGGAHVDVEAIIEEAVFDMVDMFVDLNGVSENEAKQLTLDHVKDLLGIRL